MPDEKRRHPRVELFATMELKEADDVLILSVRNISLGGVFLSADAQELARMHVGREKDLVVFDGNEVTNQVVVRARILRKDADGISLAWIGEDDMFKIASLID